MAFDAAVIESVPLWIWILYHVVILPAIIIDLIVGQKMKHDIRLKDALIWVSIWVSLAVAFGFLINHYFGFKAAAEYFTAYLVEYTLSFDNLFVFLVIFEYFAVPLKNQHKTLYIGILSAILFRASFIVGGLSLIEAYEWVMYIFAGVLIISGIRLAKGGEEKVEPERNPFVRFTRKYFPITERYYGSKFFTKINGKLMCTPLIIVLVAIETTDIMFAVDSVPAVIAITENFFLAYTSNISAVLGLRSLYFALTIIMLRLKYLNVGLSAVLTFLGIKIILSELNFRIPMHISLGVVIGIILISAFASFISKD